MKFDTRTIALCPKLCQHNLSEPSLHITPTSSMLWNIKQRKQNFSKTLEKVNFSPLTLL